MGYYIVKVYGLVCDICKASEECVPPSDASNKLNATRNMLAEPPGRWRYVNRRDICPKSDGRHIAARAEG